VSTTGYGGVQPSLFTDLYELTMAAAYFANGRTGRATFELSVRSLPANRNFLVACGLEDLLQALASWRFSDDDIAYLRTLDLFDEPFLDALRAIEFTGDVRAVPEGEVVFAGEPIVEITAPVIEGQLLETLALNVIGTRTMQASKAARVSIAAAGRSFVDFSARRDHGVDAALGAARAALVAGASATSLVEAGRRWSAPLSGTMAHAYVMAFDDERDAFRSFARTFPSSAVLLIDTWDTRQGARNAVEVAHELRAEGVTIQGVRLDSGDLATLARDVRSILDEGGCPEVRILASGDLDEHRIAELTAGGAPIDGYGVGTRMGTSEDAPSLGVVYKLVEDEAGPKLKLSEGKATLPGRKQIRRHDDHDLLTLVDEEDNGRPLIVDAVRHGTRVRDPEPIPVLQRRCAEAIATLPPRLTSLDPATPPYEVRRSARLQSLVDRLQRAYAHG